VFPDRFGLVFLLRRLSTPVDEILRFENLAFPS